MVQPRLLGERNPVIMFVPATDHLVIKLGAPLIIFTASLQLLM